MDELTSHAREERACEVRDTDLEDVFGADVEARLKSREGLPKSQEDRWKLIYRILFPQDSEDVIPPPCEFSSF
jgi:hypothetical protein